MKTLMEVKELRPKPLLPTKLKDNFAYAETYVVWSV